ncbi:MAG: hypothetical protein INR62_12390 [Rhodospirillales bacterium]|nr:hypothetical protein [Acetobacter sp.]
MLKLSGTRIAGGASVVAARTASVSDAAPPQTRRWLTGNPRLQRTVTDWTFLHDAPATGRGGLGLAVMLAYFRCPPAKCAVGVRSGRLRV